MARRMLRQLPCSVGLLIYLLCCIPVARGMEMTCEADGTCTEIVEPTPTRTILEIVNESEHRVDIHFDDGNTGAFISTLEAKGGQTSVNTFSGHSFFFTRHGVREMLFDLETDTPYRFVVPTSDEGDDEEDEEDDDEDDDVDLVLFVIPANAQPSSNLCQDRYPSCSHRAKHSQCADSPGWMIVNCCKSCDPYINSSVLIDPTIRCSKERLNITEPAWKPGDLNKLFASWANDEEFKPYEPHVLSSPEEDDDPWVVVFDNFISAEEADALIQGGELAGFDRSTDQGEVNALGEQQRVVSKGRTSSNAWCRGECERLPQVDAVTSRIEAVTKIPRKNYENFQVLRYENNQFYNTHHDSSNKVKKPAGPRILTFFLYLSDVEEGGETYFDELDIAVSPKKGRALVWSSVTDEDPSEPDFRMYHEARPVIKGTKFAANHWIHLYDFIGPNKWGCTGSFS